MLIFTLVLLLIDFTNLAKAESPIYNYDSYEYPGYEYPDSKSTCSFFFHACTDYFTIGSPSATDGRVVDLKQVPGLKIFFS